MGKIAFLRVLTRLHSFSYYMAYPITILAQYIAKCKLKNRGEA